MGCITTHTDEVWYIIFICSIRMGPQIIISFIIYNKKYNGWNDCEVKGSPLYYSYIRKYFNEVVDKLKILQIFTTNSKCFIRSNKWGNTAILLQPFPPFINRPNFYTFLTALKSKGKKCLILKYLLERLLYDNYRDVYIIRFFLLTSETRCERWRNNKAIRFFWLFYIILVQLSVRYYKLGSNLWQSLNK